MAVISGGGGVCPKPLRCCPRAPVDKPGPIVKGLNYTHCCRACTQLCRPEARRLNGRFAVVKLAARYVLLYCRGDKGAPRQRAYTVLYYNYRGFVFAVVFDFHLREFPQSPPAKTENHHPPRATRV